MLSAQCWFHTNRHLMPFTWIRSRIIVSRPKCNVLKTQEHSQSWESGGSGVNFFRLLCSDYRVNGEAIKKINLSCVVFVCNLYTSFLFPTMGMQYYNWAQVSCCFLCFFFVNYKCFYFFLILFAGFCYRSICLFWMIQMASTHLWNVHGFG